MAKRQIPFIDLKEEFAEIAPAVRKAVEAVLEAQNFVLGAPCESLERAVAEKLQTGFAVGVASGLDALLLSLKAAGIQAGDEVITTPFTFFATANAIVKAGATPVFCDIDPVTFNLDPEEIEPAVTPRTRAVLPVHLYGQCADMASIQQAASAHHLLVIEDAAQAIGARRHGTAAGAMGLAGCFSFYPTKNLGGYGDGGMIVTDDAALAEKLRMLRNCGLTDQGLHEALGYNSRLDSLQAAVLLEKLAFLDRWNEKRNRLAAIYSDALEGKDIGLPATAEGNDHTYHQFAVRTRDRDGLRQHLNQAGIMTAIYYACPLHLQPCFEYLGYGPGDFPHSESAAREVLSLPIRPQLRDEDARFVADQVVRFLDGAR
jgi:dTDP-4-amino-4,6-dideoxygalactose transaminase